MNKKLYFVPLLILLLLTTAVYGKEAEDRGGESGDSGGNSSQTEIRREPESRGSEVEVRREPEARGQEAEVRGQEAEVRGQEAEARGQEVESRGQEAQPEDEFRERVEFNVDGFEVVGPVMALSGSTITVAGQTIMIDPAQVGGFEQRGELSVGSLVKVEGVFSGDNKVAREIIVQQPENQQLKIEINDDSGREDRQENRRQDDSVLGRIISFFRSFFR